MDRLVTPVFARLWLAVFAVFFAFGTILLTVPLCTSEALGRGDVAVGVAAGVASVTALLFGPASGRIADRRGRRPCSCSALPGCCSATARCCSSRGSPD